MGFRGRDTHIYLELTDKILHDRQSLVIHSMMQGVPHSCLDFLFLRKERVCDNIIFSSDIDDFRYLVFFNFLFKTCKITLNHIVDDALMQCETRRQWVRRWVEVRTWIPWPAVKTPLAQSRRVKVVVLAPHAPYRLYFHKNFIRILSQLLAIVF